MIYGMIVSIFSKMGTIFSRSLGRYNPSHQSLLQRIIPRKKKIIIQFQDLQMVPLLQRLILRISLARLGPIHFMSLLRLMLKKSKKRKRNYRSAPSRTSTNLFKVLTYLRFQQEASIKTPPQISHMTYLLQSKRIVQNRRKLYANQKSSQLSTHPFIIFRQKILRKVSLRPSAKPGCIVSKKKGIVDFY